MRQGSNLNQYQSIHLLYNSSQRLLLPTGLADLANTPRESRVSMKGAQIEISDSCLRNAHTTFSS